MQLTSSTQVKINFRTYAHNYLSVNTLNTRIIQVKHLTCLRSPPQLILNTGQSSIRSSSSLSVAQLLVISQQFIGSLGLGLMAH